MGSSARIACCSSIHLDGHSTSTRGAIAGLSSCSNQGFQKKQMTGSRHNTTFSRTTDLKASLKDSPTEHIDCRPASDVCMIHCWCDAALFVFFQFARRAPVGDVTRHAADRFAAVSFREWTREGGREKGDGGGVETWEWGGQGEGRNGMRCVWAEEGGGKDGGRKRQVVGERKEKGESRL